MNSEEKITPPTDLEVAKRIAVGLGYDWDKQCWINDASSLKYCFIYAARCLGCFNLPYTDRIAELEQQVEAERRKVAELEAKFAVIDTPEIHNFIKAVPLEAQHQRGRWGTDHDSGKTPADWFWLIGYLAGKALASHIAGNTEKALHHTISSAAALCNWHSAILGKANMRPGIDSTALRSPQVKP